MFGHPSGYRITLIHNPVDCSLSNQRPIVAIVTKECHEIEVIY